jgi:hypothetical protein
LKASIQSVKLFKDSVFSKLKLSAKVAFPILKKGIVLSKSIAPFTQSCNVFAADFNQFLIAGQILDNQTHILYQRFPKSFTVFPQKIFIFSHKSPKAVSQTFTTHAKISAKNQIQFHNN